MAAMLPLSWRSPPAGVRLSSLSILFGAQLDAVGGGVLLDAGDPLGAGDRGDVITLGEWPAKRDLGDGGTDLDRL
jgi:hypothetical protein